MKRRSGYTLLELLVAISIFSLVAAAIGTSAVACLKLCRCRQPVTASEACYAPRVVLVEHPSLRQRLLHGGGIDGFHVETLHPRAYCLEQFLRLTAHHDEECLRWWFLNEFQHLVGAL